MDNNFKYKVVSFAVLAALSQMSVVNAADAVADKEMEKVAEAAAQQADIDAPLSLDTVVVTGTAKKVSKMKSSVSVSTLSQTQIQNTGAVSSAEVLRNIPGMRAEASGGESNFNLTSRGLPISAGGARWVQMQEDGLPVLQIGDLNFATPDTWLRMDMGLDKIEVVRGGSGSTAATSAPGGVINFISNTGERKVRKIGISTGVNFQEYRTDFAFGGPMGNGLRSFVSGFYRSGEGIRDSGNSTMSQGGQIKGNITKDLDDRGSYARVNFKYLDDKTPALLRVPTGGGNGKIGSGAPGQDPRTWSPYELSIRDVSRGKNNSVDTTNLNDGVQAKTKAIGFEFSYNFANGMNFTNKFRYADNDGSWAGLHSADGLQADGTYTGVLFNTKLNDYSLVANDAKLSAAFDTGAAGTFTPSVGVYYSKQNVAATWSFNAYTINPAAKTATFLNNSNEQWGNCCTRNLDAEYKTISPYISLAWEVDNFNFDASVRQDNQDVTGFYNTSTPAAIGAPVAGVFDRATRNKVDYDIDHTSYSVGANYLINKNTSVFARASNGVAFNGDRIMYGSANLDGGKIPINEADQQEVGIKWRNGNFNTFITFFKAKVDESNYDASTNTASASKYDNKGVEVEAGYSIGKFRVNGGLTYTDAEQTGVPSANKNVQRQAEWVYQMTPSYRFSPKLTIFGNVVGTSSSKDSGVDDLLPSYAIYNAGVRYKHDKRITLMVSANNLTDKIGWTEADVGGATARSVDGRSVRASLVYNFQ